MRVLMSVCLALFALVGSASARLGETEKDCDKRYGEAVSEERTEEKVKKTYVMGDYTIQVAMTRETSLFLRRRYRATAIRVTHRAGLDQESRPIEQDAIAEILKANGGGSRWNEVNPSLEAARRTSIEDQAAILKDSLVRDRWTRSDGATAVYSKQDYVLVMRMPGGGTSDKSEAATLGF